MKEKGAIVGLNAIGDCPGGEQRTLDRVNQLRRAS
jgi:hypothetical protein